MNTVLNLDTDVGSYSFNTAQALQERVFGTFLIDYSLLEGYPNVRISGAMRFRTLSETADPVNARLRLRHGGTAVHHFGSLVTGEVADGKIIDDFSLGGAWIGAWDDFGSQPPPAVYPGVHNFAILIPRPANTVEQLSLTVTGIDSVGPLDQTLQIVGFSISVEGHGASWRVPLLSPAKAATAKGAAELGVDVACIEDVDSRLSLAAAIPNLAMALTRRLITPRGGLFYAPDYGLDLRAYLHAGVSDAEMATLPDQIRLEVEKDERVQSATVRVKYNRQAQTLKVAIVVRTSVGPFRMVVGVSQLTVELLGLQETGVRSAA